MKYGKIISVVRERRAKAAQNSLRDARAQMEREMAEYRLKRDIEDCQRLIEQQKAAPEEIPTRKSMWNAIFG